jgi:hypothetical protein
MPSTSLLQLLLLTQEEPDEISLQVGDPILVLETDGDFNDGWYLGLNLKRQRGLFPINFVTETNIHNVPDADLQWLRQFEPLDSIKAWSVERVCEWAASNGFKKQCPLFDGSFHLIRISIDWR